MDSHNYSAISAYDALSLRKKDNNGGNEWRERLLHHRSLLLMWDC